MVAMDDGQEAHVSLTFRFKTKAFIGTPTFASKMGTLQMSTIQMQIVEKCRTIPHLVRVGRLAD